VFYNEFKVKINNVAASKINPLLVIPDALIPMDTAPKQGQGKVIPFNIIYLQVLRKKWG